MTRLLVELFKVYGARLGFPASRRLIFFSFSILLLSSALLCHQFQTLGASPPKPVRLSPHPPVHIADHTGEMFNVSLELADVENLHSANFVIAYDSMLLSVPQVNKGSFWPNDASFHFETNELLGLVELNMSLPSNHAPLGGNGSVAELLFEVDQAPSEIDGSPVRFLQFQLFDANLEELDCKSVSAIFFWQSAQPRTPDGERHVDLYTQKGGVGLGEFGGWFGYGDLVTLQANVTYASWPQQNLLVAFQVLNPSNETVLILVTETDENGIAEASFRIPQISESVGLWTAISSVDIACEVVWDTLTFHVSPPVGGETTTIKLRFAYAVYFALVGMMMLALLGSKRAIGGSRKRSVSVASRLTMLRRHKQLSGNDMHMWGMT